MNNRILVIGASSLVVILIIGAVVVLSGKTASTKSTASATSTPAAAAAATGSGKLEITDEVVGTGAEAVAGKTVTVNYVGTLKDGKVFDTNTDASFGHQKPFDFVLGNGEVIKGWDQGVAGMKVGGKRKLVIPPDLAYGPQAMGGIPANSDLVFDVELLGVK